MRLSLYTLLALLSSFFILLLLSQKRWRRVCQDATSFSFFFSGQIASLYTYTIVYVTFLCTPETFGAPEVYLNTSKSAWRNKKQQNKTRSSAGRHWLYKHTDEPHGGPTGGKKQNGMGEDEILYSIESRGIFRYFLFSVDVEIAPCCCCCTFSSSTLLLFALSLSSVRECSSCLFLSSWFSFISAAKTCRPNDTHARKLFLLFFSDFFIGEKYVREKSFYSGQKKNKNQNFFIVIPLTTYKINLYTGPIDIRFNTLPPFFSFEMI